MALQHLEEKLDELLVKKAPYQLPENARKTLVQYMPWITLAGGVLSLLAAAALYPLLTFTDRLSRYADELNRASGYGYAAPSTHGIGAIAWLSLLLLLAEALIFFMAFAPLKTHKKQGWTMLYWVALLNVGYIVVMLIANMQFGSFIFSLVGEVIGLYLLFQVRSYYLGTKTGTPIPTPSTPSSTQKK